MMCESARRRNSTHDPPHLLSDGRAILTQANGQICFLQRHRGNRPISFAELEKIELGEAMLTS